VSGSLNGQAPAMARIVNETNIISVLENFKFLNLSQNIDFDKFNQYTITQHSTTIEGSTLTELETQLLLDEGITPKGKPLLHSLMVQDHYNALLFIIDSVTAKKNISPEFIQQINAMVMKQTGNIYNTVFGELDSSKGVFRKGNVSAGNTYFIGYDKVEGLIKKLSATINEKLLEKNTIQQLDIAFDAHFDLVTIHPFYDGNGRTSRLLMNYLQLYFELPMGIVFKEDKAEYFESLQKTRQHEEISIFRKFMYTQYAKYLQLEIDKFEKINGPEKKKGNGYSLIF
jgi:Fic family protein